MNCRRAREQAKLLRADFPQLRVEVWAIAQGLAYIQVQTPINGAWVERVLHNERELSAFRRGMAEL